MGRFNFLVEGVSGAGKTSVCHELRRRGHEAFNGDTDLAYCGDPTTGEPLAVGGHGNHIWPVGRVRELAADRSSRFTFFCGGSRNFERFLDVFDEVFVLVVDEPTLRRRLAGRGDDEFGGTPGQLAMVLRLMATGEDQPREAVRIDATEPLGEVVDELLRHAETVAGG